MSKPEFVSKEQYINNINRKDMDQDSVRQAFIESAKKREQIKAEIRQKKESQNSTTQNMQPNMPSWSQMAKNLGQSIINNAQSVMAGNPLKLSDEEATARLEICKKCEFFDSQKERCGKCGCKMAVKTYLKAEKCPMGKW